MENVEREINLKNSNLNLKLASYTPEDVDEFDVGEKIYLKKFEEIDRIHGELANLINGFRSAPKPTAARQRRATWLDQTPAGRPTHWTRKPPINSGR